MVFSNKHTVKEALATYDIVVDPDLMGYNLILITVNNCPYCGANHSHGPTEYMPRLNNAEEIVKTKIQGTKRRANCSNGQGREYILNFQL